MICGSHLRHITSSAKSGVGEGTRESHLSAFTELKTLVESRTCCWQMCEVSQGSNLATGHGTCEHFHAGDIVLFFIF